MEHLSNALRALFAEQDGDNVLYKAGLLKKNNKYTSDECINLDTELKESHVMSLLKRRMFIIRLINRLLFVR